MYHFKYVPLKYKEFSPLCQVYTLSGDTYHQYHQSEKGEQGLGYQWDDRMEMDKRREI